MKSRKFLTGVLGLSFAVACYSVPAHASEGESNDDQSVWDVEAGIELVSDYRFRGISLSDKDPAIQPSLTISHGSGLYAGFWGSTIADNGGDNVETDLTFGFAREVGKLSVDLSANWYLYPDMPGDNYLELIARAGVTVGNGEIGFTYAYAPPQDHIGGIANHYAMVDGSVPIPHTPLSLQTGFGIEDGAFGDNKLDWSIGVKAELKGFTFGATYVDSAHNDGDPLGKAGIVFSVGRTF